MAIKYPASIDSSITLPIAQDNITIIDSKLLNTYRSAILAIETELGIKPSGLSSTVSSRLTSIDNSITSIINALSDSGTFLAGGDLSGTSINQSVIAIRGNSVANQILGPSNDGAVLTWNDTDGYWEAIIPASGAFTAGGDLSGSTINQTVEKIKGTTITTAGGALTTGTILRVTGPSTIDYGALNLSNANAVTGTLPKTNQASQDMVGDVSGTTAASVVDKIKGKNLNASVGTVGASQDGYALVWDNATTSWKPSAVSVDVSSLALKSTTISAGTGLTGGGDLSANRTLSANFGSSAGTICEGNDSRLSDSRAPSGSASGDLSGSYPSPTVNRIQGILVNSTAPSDGQVLTYDNDDGYWKPATPSSGFTASGDLSGTPSSQTVIAIQGNDVMAQVLSVSDDGYVLTWDNADNRWEAKPPSGGGFTAGGDLSGTSTNQNVIRLNGNSIVSQTLNSLNDGYSLTWSDVDGYWVAKSGVNSTTIGDFNFLKETNHTIRVNSSTSSNTAGGSLSVLAGNASGNANGGALTLDGGQLAGSGSGGVVSIGTTNASAINIGRSGISTTFTGSISQSTGSVALTANSASSLTTSSGALTLTSAAAATWETTAGNLTVKGGASLILNGTNWIGFYNDATYAGGMDGAGLTFAGDSDKAFYIEQAAVGKNFSIRAGDATGGDGGYVEFRGGNAGGGNFNGGDLYIKGGASSGSGYNGSIYFTAGTGAGDELLQLISPTYYGAGVGKFVSINGQFTNSGTLTSNHGSGVTIVVNAATPPTTGYTGAALLYSEGGVLKTVDSSGNIYALGAAGGSTNGLITLSGDLAGTGSTAASPKVGSLTGSGGTLNIATTSAIFNWASGTVSPTIKQADDANNSITADALTIQAQNATGTTSTGGALNLTSGTGTTVAGNILLQTGGVSRISISPSASTILNTLTIGSSGPTITQGTGVPAGSEPNGSVYLRTDGTSSTGIYTRQSSAWSAVGATAPSGSDTQIQFNDGGSFGGDAGLTYNKTTKALTLDGTISVGPNPNTTDGYIRLGEPGLGTKTIISGRSYWTGSWVDQPILQSYDGYRLTLGQADNWDVQVYAQNLGLWGKTSLAIFAGTGGGTVGTINGNGWQFGSGSADFGSGEGVIGIDNATTNPSTNPTNGIVAYVDAGDGYLKYRKSDGTVISLNGAGTGGSPGGSTTQIQFNDAGAFNGDAGLTYDKSTNVLSISDGLSIGAVPSSDGTIRLSNGGNLRFRNNANSNNITILDTNSSDDIFVGGNASYATQASNLRLHSGNVYIGRGSTSYISVDSTGTFLGHANLYYSSSIVSPKLYQADDTNNSITGDTLTLQAQNATGTTSTGGGLDLTSGTGTTIAGNVNLQTGGTNRITISPTASTILNTLTIGSAGPTITKGTGAPASSEPDGSLYLRTDGTSSTGIYTRQSSAWSAVGGGTGSAAGSDTQVQFNDGGTAFGGDAGLTYNKTTNVLSISDGLAVGANVSSAGSIRLSNGGDVFFRNNANSNNIAIIDTNTSDEVFIGGNASYAEQAANLRLYSTNVYIGRGSTTHLSIDSTGSVLGHANLYYSSSIVSPKLYQADDTNNSAAADALTIQAQNATGTTSTGGNLILTSGTGTSADGYVNIQVGGANIARCIEDKFITSAGVRRNNSVKTSSYTIVAGDDVILVGSRATTIEIDLPASPVAGDTYVVKDQAGLAATYNITVDGNGNNIDGAATYVMNANYQSITLIFGNSSWSII